MSKTREFHRPEDWSEAHQLLSRSGIHTVPLAVSPRPTALGDLDADAFVDLEKLHLNYIKQEEGLVHIGALTTLQEIYLSDLIKSQAGGVLVKAAYLTATLGLRNLASLAGAITNPENPPEIALVLMTLDAVVTVQKDAWHTRQVALHEWMKDCGKVLLPGEAILEVSFKSQTSSQGAIARVSRTPRDKAIVAAVAVLQVEAGVCKDAGLALAGSNPVPVRLLDAEALFSGKQVNADLIAQAAKLAVDQAAPVADYRGSVEYRKAMAGVLVKRALTQALDGQG
jgi:carbon-monoxide dehydrogenase medium subunit